MQSSKSEASQHRSAKAPPPHATGDKPGRAPPRGLTAVSDAVRAFLTKEFHAQEVRVTRIAPLSGGDGGWEAEAEILVPDLAIKTLGLPLTQEVLESRRYAVHLDQSLAITGYEPLDDDG
jgi:hypothetical protein